MPYIKHMLNRASLSTKKSICSSAPRVGRTERYPEKKEAGFERGTLARIEAVLKDGENARSFIRDATMAELKKRGG